MRIPDLDIYEGLPDRTLINSRDVVAIFGYSKGYQAANLYPKGLIPKPTGRIPNGLRNNQPRSPTTFWKLGDLRKLKIKLDKKEE